jgi:hypothetical protein
LLTTVAIQGNEQSVFRRWLVNGQKLSFTDPSSLVGIGRPQKLTLGVALRAGLG